MIPRRHVRESWKSGVRSLGRAPVHKAICYRKTPSSNLLLILITDREPRLCLWRFLRDAAVLLQQEPQGGCRCSSHVAADFRRGSFFMLNSLLQSTWGERSHGDLSVATSFAKSWLSLLQPSVDSLASYSMMYSCNMATLPELDCENTVKKCQTAQANQ